MLFTPGSTPVSARHRSPPSELADLHHDATATTREVHIPYSVEQDEDGVWCAHAQLLPHIGAHGEGATPDDAVEDLREALSGLIAEFGVPQELPLTLDVG